MCSSKCMSSAVFVGKNVYNTRSPAFTIDSSSQCAEGKEPPSLMPKHGRRVAGLGSCVIESGTGPRDFIRSKTFIARLICLLITQAEMRHLGKHAERASG